MTIDEVKRIINEGGVIACNDLCQRDEALQFLMDIGYEIHPDTKIWIESNPGRMDFMYPGLDRNGDIQLTLWSITADKTLVSFSAIKELIIQNDVPIDERSSKEFLDAFIALIS